MTGPGPRHPLDPLTAEEIRLAVEVLRREQDLGEDARFPLVTLREPDKQVVLGFRPGDAIDRQVSLVILDRADGATYEAVVSVTEGVVRTWRHVPGVQPSVLLEEILSLGDIVRSSPAWRDAMAARGVTDLDRVQIDPWPAGSFGLPVEEGRRLLRATAYVRDTPTDNGYAHPVEGMVAFVDLNARAVVEVMDAGVVPIPPTAGNYDAASAAPLRTDLKPIDISQPEGPSFVVDGGEVRWQKWRLRFSLHPLEGLVLHTVGYEDGGRVRSILYRGGLSDMVVPYGDPSPGQYWKNAFDAGEFGIGKLVVPLELGCDCLGEIRYFDAVMADDAGEPFTIANAVCMHEEDYGILWKHTDFFSDVAEVRRSRRLVISTIANLGPYDYGFFWYLYLDGTIQLEVKLTGIVQTAAIAAGQDPAFGTMVAPQLYAPNHQHLFNVRLDLDVDGTANTVREVDVVPVPLGPDNEHGNAFRSVATPLRRESEAQRVIDPGAARTWHVINPSVRNALGQPVGYKLVPGPTALSFADEGSSIARRAGFTRKHLWVTPFAPDERHAAGDYPNQHPGGAGLPAWTAADRPLEDTDVVLWHTFAATHIPRPEDWPVMPVEYVGFTLKPVGFFDRNPALDVPPPHGHGHGAGAGAPDP